MARRYRPIDVGEKIVLGDQHSNDGIKWHATLGGGHTFGDPDVTMPPFYRRPLKKGERWPTSANNASTKCPHCGRGIMVAVTSCVA